MPKLTDGELLAAIESAETLALDSLGGSLATDRATALDRYKGAPLGNEVEGRSQIVSHDVADQIEWIMPSLMRIYLGGDEIGRFEPRGPEDEKAAERETEVCNWYLTAKNDAYTQIHAALKDALLLRNGYLIAYWQTRTDVVTETYRGLADEEAALLMQDDEVKIVEHSEYPDPSAAATVPSAPDAEADRVVPQQPSSGMLHDLKLERTRPEEYVAVESVPPDELLVSHRHRWTSLLDVDFVQWRRRITIGELRAQGFEVPDDAPGDTDDSTEWAARQRFAEVSIASDDTPDPARRMVTWKDTYIRIDLRGTGQQQLWRVCHVSGSSDLLLKEEADLVPFAAFVPIIYPHSHVGMSVYDLISDLSLIKTTLQRQLLDNVYLANNTQTVVDVNRVNLDDWLVSRPGGVKRVEGAVGDAYAQLVSPDVSGNILAAISYIDQEKESRTGVTKYAAGLDANSLNKTATGVQQIQAAANQRIELIARTLATGFKDLFLIIHALACKHSTKPLQIKLGNEWTLVDPRSWTKRTDFSISVGLGTGTPEQMLTKLQMLMPLMAQAAQIGLADAENFYNLGVEFLKATGYRNAHKFLRAPQRDPQTGQVIPHPPQPNPLVQAEQEKGKVAVTIAQLKAQHDAQMEQMKMQTSAAKESAQMQADLEVERQKIQSEYELNIAKARMDLELDAARHGREQETAIQKAAIAAAAQIEVARIGAGISDGSALEAANAQAAGLAGEALQPMAAAMVQQSLQPLLEQVQAAAQAIAQAANTPKRIVRDPRTGRAIGVEPVQPTVQ